MTLNIDDDGLVRANGAPVGVLRQLTGNSKPAAIARFREAVGPFTYDQAKSLFVLAVLTEDRTDDEHQALVDLGRFLDGHNRRPRSFAAEAESSREPT